MRFHTICLTLLLSLKISVAAAQTSTASSEPELDQHPYHQTIGIDFGSFRPQSISFSNSDYKFDYSGKSLDTLSVEPRWSLKLFKLLGAFYLEDGLPISFFKGTLADGEANLFMLGVDARLKYAMEWLPVRWIVPFIDGGYQFSFYSQSGASEFDSVQGTFGNFVAGAGIDFWINPSSSDALSSMRMIPVFISLRINRILPSSSSIDFTSTSYLGGLSVGI